MNPLKTIHGALKPGSDQLLGLTSNHQVLKRVGYRPENVLLRVDKPRSY
jgi:hypothetical protein